MSKQSYLSKMTPYAKRASQLLQGRLSWEVILSQWAHETGYGSPVSKEHNNHAGIKSNSHGKDYDGGTYAGYNSIDNFVKDYVRVMNLSYYKNVKGSKEQQINELHKSPWAEDPEYDHKLKRVFESIGFGELKGIDAGELTSNIENIFSNLSEEEMKKYALAGVGLVAILSLLKS